MFILLYNLIMKILIIRFSSLGDIVLTLPVIKNIKLNDENSEIYYLTKKQFGKILSRNKDIKEVLEFSSVKDLFEIGKKYEFDLIIDLHSNIRSFLACKIIKAQKKIKYDKDSLYRRLFVNFRILSPKLEKHVVERYLSVLEKTNFKIIDKKPDIKNADFSEKLDSKPRKILIIQTAFLGDLMLTLPMIKKIKSEIKDSYISILIRKDTAKAVEGVKEIDEIICDEKKERPFLAEFKRIIELIKNKGFDIAIIPHRSLRSALIAFFAKIKIRIGFDIKPSSFFYTHRIPFSWLVHDAERNFMLLSPLIKEGGIEFPEMKEASNGKFGDIIKIKPLILINPSSVWETKRWPEYKFASLIDKLYSEYSVTPVLIGSGKEKEYCDKIKEIAGDAKCLNMAGKTSLDELVWLIKKSDILITNDSGPMHIATALGVWVVAIFGPTTRELGFFPYSEKSIVLEKDLLCRPCRLHGSRKCPHSHFLCMKLIKVEEVIKAVQKILKYNYE